MTRVDLQIWCRSCGEQRDTFKATGRAVFDTDGKCPYCGSTRTCVEVLP
ncbi:ribosome associated inhibitor A; zinc finger domain [Haloarcula hispanica virus SH1]|uniref:ORF 38 n=1 Tax=Haloarcula hispanica SH1 virus TaxID=326574 RepID=Q4KPE9_9VIRU|nr:ribosome associated inhibitor A; zinc finger domain [Haloarcula hispanica virus SH1]AAY24964.1 ORF 38 [Haloarcula hispanica virus SH1]